MGIQTTGLYGRWHSVNWKVLRVSLKTDTLHLLMYTLEQYEQAVALRMYCVQCLCVSYQAVVTTQHCPIRNTLAHTTWTRSS